REQMSRGVTLTDSLIAMRNLPPLRPESRSTELLSPCAIRLDRENICAIGRLQSPLEIHSLYLQQNQIEKIENLGSFPNLQFLSLAGNRICRVENLQHLQHLRALDLSHNLIQTLDPASVVGERLLFLNACRDLVMEALPHLLQLDGQQVCSSVGEEKEDEDSSSSEDEDEESLYFFVDLHQELVGRSQQRQREALEEHRTRLAEVEMLREHRGLLLPPVLLSPGREGETSIVALGPRRSQPNPQVKQRTQLPPLPGPSRQHPCLQPQQAPAGSRPWTRALGEEIGAKGARNGKLPQITRTSTASHSWD
ncbi:PREDICTED: leucine-rich repeat-containing protein 46, partial [Mesitornis unicolor]|uniref:leucine-rich repeat-containing protein 46 n=1 Tax=Mesitornis unicolor TaxID=54374 RepID=UPI0005289203